VTHQPTVRDFPLPGAERVADGGKFVQGCEAIVELAATP